MIYNVSYDLQTTLFRNVTPFLQELQRTDGGRTWWHFLTNTWLLSTPETAQQLFERLQPHLQAGDRLLILGATSEHSGFLPPEAWQWIQERTVTGEFTLPNARSAITLTDPQYARSR